MSPIRQTPKKRRIAHITLGLEVGGQEKLLVEFARHADRARHELAFISLSGRGKLAENLEDLGGKVITLEQVIQAMERFDHEFRATFPKRN